MIKKKTLHFLLKLLVGLTVFSIIIWKIGLDEILQNLIRFDMSYVLLVMLIYPTTFIIAAIGVIFLGRSINPKLEWSRATKGFLATISLAIFVPGRLGDFTLPYYWKDFLSYGESLSVLLIDKLITVVWIAGLGSGLIYVMFNQSMGLLALTGFLFLLGAVLWIFGIQTFRAHLYRFLPQKLFDFFQGFIAAIRLVIKDGKYALLATFMITGLRMSLYGIFFWLLLMGLGVSCPFYFPIFALAVAQLVSILPVSIMGFGTVEAVCLLIFGRIDVSAGPVIAACLMGRLMTLLWLGLFFTMFAMRSKLPARQNSANIVEPIPK